MKVRKSIQRTTLSARKRRPHFLVCNDDGIYAPGIHALVRELSKTGDVSVVAPDTQQSAVGHAITVSYPLRAHKYFIGEKFFGYAVAGTPADAVKLGVKSLLRRKPDVLVSGINHGSNTAISVIYSGTVSAATEGTILGIPSIAVSLTTYGKADFSYAAIVARKIAMLVFNHGLPRGTLLNVNVPAVSRERIEGIMITHQGRSTWDDHFDMRKDPGNKEYYWLTGRLENANGDPGSDQWAIERKFVSVTPIHYDLTDYTMAETLAKWGIERLR